MATPNLTDFPHLARLATTRYNPIMKFSISLILAGLTFASVASADELMTVARAGNAAVVRMSSGRFSSPQIWTLSPFQRRVRLSVDEEKTSSAPTLSPDGKWVAWGCKDGTLRVFSARNGSLRARPGRAHIAKKEDYSDQPYQVRALAFSPDGKTLAWANYKGLFLLDWRRNKLIYSRPIPTQGQRSLQQPVVLSFSGDGRYIAIGGQNTHSDDGEDAHIFLLDSAGSLRRHWRMDCGDGEPIALNFSPDAKSLLVVSDRQVSVSDFDKADLFSISAKKRLWHHDNEGLSTAYSTSTGTDRSPNAAAFSRDGTRVAIGGRGTEDGGDENFLEIRRASNGKVLSLTHKPNGVLPLDAQKKLRPELTFH